MKSVLIFISLLLILLFFNNCRSPACACDYTLPDNNWRIDSGELSYISLPVYLSEANIKNDTPNSKFGVTTYNRNDSLFLIYVSIDNKLVFSNLFDSSNIYKSDFPYRANSNHKAMVRTYGDTLLLINKHDSVFMKFSINSDFSATLIQKINLNEIVKIKNWFVHYNFNAKRFDYHYPFLLVPYGKRKGELLYDRKSYLLINTATLSVNTVLDFPACYSSCFVFEESVSAAIRDNKVYGLFSRISIISEYDLNTGEQLAINLPLSSPFISYDRRKIHNLAYARKYENLNEINTNLFLLQNGKRVAIKRLSKKAFGQKNTYRYYIFDHNHNFQIGTFPQPIFDLLSTPYKTGFLVFNDSLSNAFFYDVR